MDDPRPALWRDAADPAQIDREALLALAGMGELPPEAAMLGGLMARRFSCRAFRPEPVPEAVVMRLVAMAQLSASWCNTQPWRLIVTTGAATERFRQALLRHAAERPPREGHFDLPAAYEGVYRHRRLDAALRLFDAAGIAREDRAATARQALENYRLFGAPHVMILTTDRELGAYGALDCGVFLGSLMLAAQAMGVDTIAQGAFAFVAPFVAEFFGLPPDRKVIRGVSFGYGDHAHPANGFRTPRAAPDSAVTWVRT